MAALENGIVNLIAIVGFIIVLISTIPIVLLATKPSGRDSKER